MSKNFKSNFSEKVISASKWSMLSEVAYRAISPIVFLVMARLLSPEDYGVMSVATIILGFVQLIGDLGLSRVIVQRNFDKLRLGDIATVAFWTNLVLGLGIFLILFMSSHLIAVLLGEPKAGLVIKIMSIQVIFYSLMSVQNALLQRSLDFKLLFYVRLTTVIFPALASIPLAYFGFGYWALVAGNLFGVIMNTFALWKVSNWRPRIYYDIKILIDSLRFSLWNTVEALVSWLFGWGDAMLVAAYLSTQSLGLFTTGNNAVQIIFTVFLSPLLPVVFSSLSRLQSNEENFKSFFLSAHKIICMISFPVGVGLFLFADLIEHAIFGQNWNGVGWIIGVLGLMNGVIFFVKLNGEGYRAKGRAEVNTIIMLINLVIYIPVYFMAIRYGLKAFVVARSIVAFVQIPYHFYFSNRVFKVSFIEAFKNIRWIIMGVIAMSLFYLSVAPIFPEGMVYEYIVMIFCAGIYLAFLIPEKVILNKIIKYAILKGNNPKRG